MYVPQTWCPNCRGPCTSAPPPQFFSHLMIPRLHPGPGVWAQDRGQGDTHSNGGISSPGQGASQRWCLRDGVGWGDHPTIWA
jgi:hypothetical protein